MRKVSVTPELMNSENIFKIKRREYARKYRIKHPDRILLRQQKIPKEKKKEYNKRYLTKHPERRALTSKKYYEKIKSSREPYLKKRDKLMEHIDEIVRLYKEELLNLEGIGKIYECSSTPIREILKKNDVLMGMSKRRKLLDKFGKLKHNNKNLNKEKIINMYKNHTLKEIAKEMNCSECTINKILNKNKINRSGHKGRLHYFSKWKEIKNNFGEKIISLYSDGKSLKEISNRLNCEVSMLCKIMDELGMKRRTIKEAKSLKDYSGENSPTWQGGLSYEPYGLEFNKRLKEQTRERDNHQCQECGKTEYDLSFQKLKYNKSLRVHHIDYDKRNNNPLNLISLCLRCHAKTNFNRKHWENYFKMKMFIKELFNPQNILIFNENKQLIGMEKIK